MQKYSLEVVLYKSVKPQHSEYPIYIRLTVGGKCGYRATGYWVRESEWSGREVVGRSNSKTINASIKKKKEDALQELVAMELKNIAVTHQSLAKKPSLDSFYKYYREVQKVDGGGAADTEVYRISEYCDGRAALPGQRKQSRSKAKRTKLAEPIINAIDVAWCRRFADYMGDIMLLGEGTIATTFKGLRKVMKQAADEKLIPECPIGQDKGQYKPPSGKKKSTPVFLEEEERNALLLLLDDAAVKADSKLYMGLVYFLFGCFSGLRHSDWEQFRYEEHIIEKDSDPKIVLRTTKTDELVVMPMGITLTRIVDIIKAIGPLALTYNEVMDRLEALEKLAIIKKHLRTHVARHTFGYMCATVFKLEKIIAAHYMGISVEVVETYYHLGGKHIMARSQSLRAV